MVRFHPAEHQAEGGGAGVPFRAGVSGCVLGIDVYARRAFDWRLVVLTHREP